MLDKLQAICNKYEELSAKSEQPDFYADPQKAAKLLREKNDLEPIVEAFHAYNQAQQDMADAQELMADPEMKELCQETYAAAKAQKEALAEKIQILLLPKDPNDEKNVIMEIRGGVGGEESALFAHSLLRMYSMYAAKMGWSIELMNLNETDRRMCEKRCAGRCRRGDLQPDGKLRGIRIQQVPCGGICGAGL